MGFVILMCILLYLQLLPWLYFTEAINTTDTMVCLIVRPVMDHMKLDKDDI